MQFFDLSSIFYKKLGYIYSINGVLVPEIAGKSRFHDI